MKSRVNKHSRNVQEDTLGPLLPAVPLLSPVGAGAPQQPGSEPASVPVHLPAEEGTDGVAAQAFGSVWQRGPASVAPTTSLPVARLSFGQVWPIVTAA